MARGVPKREQVVDRRHGARRRRNQSRLPQFEATPQGSGEAVQPHVHMQEQSAAVRRWQRSPTDLRRYATEKGRHRFHDQHLQGGSEVPDDGSSTDTDHEPAHAEQDARVAPQWIEDNWVGKYERGVGNVRIPDVVIVKDPAKEPTQDNLDAVVEMKFKGDTYSTRHQSQDELIAGPNASAVLLTPEDCGCPDDDGKKQERASEFPVLGPAPRDATDGASKAAPWNPFDELEGATKRSRSVFGPRPPDGAAPAPSPSPIPLF